MARVITHRANANVLASGQGLNAIHVHAQKTAVDMDCAQPRVFVIANLGGQQRTALSTNAIFHASMEYATSPQESATAIQDISPKIAAKRNALGRA